MSNNKKNPTNNKKQIEPSFREAKGTLDSVGTQGGTLYMVISGRRINVSKSEKVEVKILK